MRCTCTEGGELTLYVRDEDEKGLPSAGGTAKAEVLSAQADRRSLIALCCKPVLHTIWRTLRGAGRVTQVDAICRKFR